MALPPPALPTDGPASGSHGPVPLTRRERLRVDMERFLDRRLSPLGVCVYRRTRGRITGPWKVDALVLTTHGRRSGTERSVVLQFFRDGAAMVLAAVNDGGERHPGWYHNLVADPLARVEVMGRTIQVRAEELGEQEAAEWWQRVLRRAPTYERFARATSRRIPIMRLVPIEPA